MSNFIADCIQGDALMTDIDDYVDSWHDGNSDLSLHEFLGMSRKEYALYLEDEMYLASIITAHRSNLDIVPVMLAELRMAARSDDPTKAKKLQKWLENENLWD
ncbi:hypothetical protein IM793_06215 [Pedobacter sp. MR2016-19]|uniref:hypothetical protein n=1 Tax=Pedobacter sp. MR2016-19 TaxID=2780089 RepID=UPI00187720CF|nr:hypothetical protein [Pedobacter sp. MR2016-19]MBE5318739.1 hypothetical protein [Pedobacter sp. MR2016-19]